MLAVPVLLRLYSRKDRRAATAMAMEMSMSMAMTEDRVFTLLIAVANPLTRLPFARARLLAGKGCVEFPRASQGCFCSEDASSGVDCAAGTTTK